MKKQMRSRLAWIFICKYI